MWQKDLEEKFFKCFHCQRKGLLRKYFFQKQKIIGEQKFFFFTCFRCKEVNYFWSFADQYFFTQKIHLVLHQPEIAGNVGSIIRLAVALNLPLHLIEPFGFLFSESWLKRSSVNHFHLAKIKLYSDWNSFSQHNYKGVFILTSAKGKKNLSTFNFLNLKKPIYLVFGCESKGLPLSLKQKYSEHLLYIKQHHLVRSINLANAVSIFAFFAVHQYHNLD